MIQKQVVKSEKKRDCSASSVVSNFSQNNGEAAFSFDTALSSWRKLTLLQHTEQAHL